MNQEEIKNNLISLAVCCLRDSGLLIEDRSRGINNRTYSFSNDFDLLTVLAAFANLAKTSVVWSKDYLKWRFEQILDKSENESELTEILEKLSK